MRSGYAVLVASLSTLAACGGGGPAAPAGLAYGLPSPSTVTYVSGDTANMDIDAGGQSMQARTTGRATLTTAFTRAPDGIQVSLEVTDLDGRVSTPMSSASADENGITGPLVFTMDRRGVVTMVAQPELTEEASQFFSPVGLANGFFPRLPGRGAQVGEQWTDTVTFEGPQGPGQVKGVTILTYTVVGDTVVGGRSAVRLDVNGTNETTATGVITGMDFTQTLKGTTNGWVLFDMGRSLMVESYSDGDLRGTMDVAAAPFPLDVRVRSRGWVKLQDPM
ncbi:MAG TPA: hypothetical protein VLA36_06245 [Longimicrobiales bacterium]|nr:hypothetical protein [Longimicrobiales bacterium]